jgi:predicted dehydrogenase
MAASGELGKIIHVQGSYFQDWLFRDTDYNWRLLPREGGPLRAVADIGTHWLDAASFILGSPINAVLADLGTFHRTRKRPLGEVQTFSRSTVPVGYAAYRVRTEDFANILLHFRNGALGNLAVSQVAAGRKNAIRIEIYGSKKSAWWNSERPEQLEFGQRDAVNEIALRNGAPPWEGAAGYADYPAGHVEGFPDTFKMLYRNIYSVIAGGAKGIPLFATAEDGHREAVVCEAILASHRAKRWVPVRTGRTTGSR